MHDMHEIVLEGGRRFRLALPCEKGAYAAELAAAIARSNLYHQQPHIGVLALDLLRGGSLIDVGANLGVLSLAAATAGSHVLAIEPLPENAFCLTVAALENRLANLAILPLAAGDERRVVRLSGTEAWARIADDSAGIPVMMLPLDDIVELAAARAGGSRSFLRQPLLVKIDTEGSELAVLRGAWRLIERWSPNLIVECAMIEGLDHPISRKTQMVKELLEAAGYRLYLHRGNRLAPRRASDLQEGHLCDFLAMRRRYRAGDRIGRFTVGPLDEAESLRWLSEMAAHADARHRLHAVGVVARRLGEGGSGADLAAMARQLLGDADPGVSAQAARLLATVAR